MKVFELDCDVEIAFVSRCTLSNGPEHDGEFNRMTCENSLDLIYTVRIESRVARHTSQYERIGQVCSYRKSSRLADERFDPIHRLLQSWETARIGNPEMTLASLAEDRSRNDGNALLFE